jgi:hypothetical protein
VVVGGQMIGKEQAEEELEVAINERFQLGILSARILRRRVSDWLLHFFPLLCLIN